MLNYKTLLNKNSSEWVILIHGAGGSMEVWYRQVSDFSRYCNVLLLDLAGHGDSEQEGYGEGFGFATIAEQVIEVVNHLNIKKAHYMGLSLGTVIVREIAERYPEAVKSMLMVGAITRITPTLQSLLVFSEKFQRFLPFKLLKKSFTFFLVPQKRYQDSKKVFYKSGERVSYDSFVNWIRLNRGISKRLKQLFDTTATIPTVYLTGEDDWLFLNHIKRTVRYGGEKATLVIIPKSGHVCNVDNKVDFNAAAIDFMKSISTQAE